MHTWVGEEVTMMRPFLLRDASFYALESFFFFCTLPFMHWNPPSFFVHSPAKPSFVPTTCKQEDTYQVQWCWCFFYSIFIKFKCWYIGSWYELVMIHDPFKVDRMSWLEFKPRHVWIYNEYYIFLLSIGKSDSDK